MQQQAADRVGGAAAVVQQLGAVRIAGAIARLLHVLPEGVEQVAAAAATGRSKVVAARPAGRTRAASGPTRAGLAAHACRSFAVGAQVGEPRHRRALRPRRRCRRRCARTSRSPRPAAAGGAGRARRRRGSFRSGRPGGAGSGRGSRPDCRLTALRPFPRLLTSQSLDLVRRSMSRTASLRVHLHRHGQLAPARLAPAPSLLPRSPWPAARAATRRRSRCAPSR